MIAAAFILFVTAHGYCLLKLITHLREERVRHETEIQRHYSNLNTSHLDPL